MTVCIAGFCNAMRSLIAVSDQMITFGEISADAVTEKISPIHRNWFAMYAANDVTHVRPILDLVTLVLCKENRELSMVEVGEAVGKAFAHRHQSLIEHSVLVPNGFRSLDEFHDKGKTVLTRAEFARISREIRAVEPEVKFLIGGFDFAGIPHLLVQEAKSPYQCYDDPGFWAIGSGDQEAISSLIFQADKLGFSVNVPEELGIFHLLVAKFTAESNKTVGAETHVLVRRRNGDIRYIDPENVDKIRAGWEEHFMPRPPVDLIKEIPSMLVRGRRPPKD